MRRPARYALRFLVVIAIASLVPMLFNSSPAHSPYVSALSNLTVSQTLAGTTCPFKACAGGSRFNLKCDKVTTASTCSTFMGTCIENAC